MAGPSFSGDPHDVFDITGGFYQRFAGRYGVDLHGLLLYNGEADPPPAESHLIVMVQPCWYYHPMKSNGSVDRFAGSFVRSLMGAPS
jgi:hypothetical protein